MEKEERLKKALYFHNPWWTDGKISSLLTLDYKRPLLNRLLSYLSLERIIVIKGPRRTGKTTLLYQVIKHLLEKERINPKTIIYLSFDDLEVREEISEILTIYEKIVGKTIKEQSQIYFFLDEVHFLENWQFYLKKYFDKKYPLKFIVSGSSASLIKKGSESLAGRTVEETILPFRFSEFLSYKLREEKIDKIIEDLKKKFSFFSLPDATSFIPYQPKIEILFYEYLERGGFPHIFEVKEPVLWKKLLREDVIEKVIYRDLVEFFGVKKPTVLEKLFLYLAEHSSEIFSISNISNSLDLSREYVDKYLNYLQQAFLVFTLKKYSPSIEKRIRSNQKVHLIDSGLISIFGEDNESKKIESLVGRHLLNYNLSYWREKEEVDFILELDGKLLLPVEVKYRSRVDKKDLRGIIKFMEKYKVE